MAVLLDRGSFKGYNLSRDLVSEADMTELETNVSDSVDTTVAAVDVSEDEFYRVGQGRNQGPEYTEGRLYMSLDNGSGAEPTGNARVKLVTLSSQNNPKTTIFSGKYAQVSQGANDRTQRTPLPEQGNVIANPKKLGLQVQEQDGNSYTVSIADSDIQIDAIRGEK